ncbi:type IV secretory pathway TraG/TraD family ATPase VirD4 [Undibacterium sp. GrIS 1.2]|uniref:type IV secretion system DNA-binding domain-containing protein n=1 Tax=Undibacterium sp. GrIS 1.2 TaxID=3143933 RepID=UPI003394D22F
MKDLFKSFLGGSSTQCDAITLGGVPLPKESENLHCLLAGSTGTGKTTLVDEILSIAIPRHDRVIVCDPSAYHLSRFAQAGDTVLNPFDRRSPGWSVFNEVRKDFDYDRLARSLVPDGHGSDKQWHHYAQVLCAETMRALMLRGDGNTEKLMHWLTIAKAEELATLLAGTPAQGLFDKDAVKALASTRFILTTQLNPHKYLKPGEFSLRTWLESGRGNLYLTWREDMQTALMPLISTWTDIVSNAVLSLAADRERRIWLILDELGALGRLNSLESVLTRGRKHGLCVVAGLQSTAQLDRTYGRESAIVLRSCFRNLVVFAVAKSDPDTAEMLSRSLGEREVDRQQHSRSEGPNGITKGVSLQRVSERIAIASQITELPNLSAFLALSGDTPTRRIQVTPRNLPQITKSMEE